MFKRILIANRGEIACRVIRTARRFAIETVAVYSDADAAALHVASADTAIHIGGAAPVESYLDIERIVTAAKASGAEAIHPGYGFLSENADFAEACAKAGIVFIGPPASAIRAMGSKSAAKALMEKANVPVVPGYHGQNQDAAFLAKEAERIGFPVLIKAVAGGGGKGMRRVDKAAEFAEALDGAKREAKNAFRDDAVLVEKYVERPRHVEIQVFADTKGNAVYLFERDCSVQRRHQKVLEEAPAPGLPDATRKAMGEAAVAAAKAIGYTGAGTVEFIYGGGRFFFMEMNTRLQVEHPVTELVTGLDLVEWQFRVAAGEALPKRQDELALRGHAIEARLYAEDPGKEFLPAIGRLAHLALPASEPAGPVRIDTGVRQGDTVSIHYDPMIAKVVAWGEDRGSALRRMARALEETRVAGLATNRDFLHAVVTHPAFAKGDVHTGFIAEHRAALLPAAATAPDRVLALAALHSVLSNRAEAATRAAASNDPHSPWHRSDGWRLNDDSWSTFRFAEGGHEHSVTVHYRKSGYLFDLPGGSVAVAGSMDRDGAISARIGDTLCRGAVARAGNEVTIFEGGKSWRLAIVDPLAAVADVEAGVESLTAPMPGKIIAVKVDAGAKVERGQALLVMEAMKMEHTIRAPADGIVEKIHFKVGEQVDEGVELIHFEAQEGSA
ncbi:MAG: acetyl/propionyl/methylcrotonyl-CoA carboxylase subunit alpha [Alphaproteobacteria bacterium]